MEVDVVIIGGGPAGLAAALACHEKGVRSILILERDKELGGILQQCIHNGFGLHRFGQELTGPEYAERFIERVWDTDIMVKTDTMVLSVSRDRQVTAINTWDGLFTVQAKAIILAMGCRERTRGALNIPGTRPAGIYTAGCAQRLVNMEGVLPGREAVILGSGDIGLIMARRLTWEGVRVRMVCELMPYSSGLMRNIVQCLEDNDIPLRFQHTVVEIHGRDRLEAVTVARVDENRKPIPETMERVGCDTLLLSVGLLPENELTQEAGIELDPRTGGARVDQNRQTSVEGVYACGNVLHVHDLVDHVSAEAEIAGHAAADYVLGQGRRPSWTCAVQPGSGVRYVAPHALAFDGQGVDLYFRVTDVVRPARLQVARGSKVLIDRTKKVMLPGEMEKITLPAKLLQDTDGGDIVVSVEVEAHA